MGSPTLSELHNAYEEWMSPPTKTIHLRAAEAPAEGPHEMDILIFEEGGDEPFVYLATAGVSSQELAGPIPRIELVVAASGRFDDPQIASLAKRLGELSVRPFRDRSFFAPNMVIEGFSLPLFEGKNALLLADFNIRSADYLPFEPLIRVLRVTPLYPAEATLAKDIGDVELFQRFQAEGLNHEDPARRSLSLSAAPPAPSPPVDTGDTIRDVWDDIEAWLRANAPPTLDALRSGAEEASIDALEQTLGLRLPIDYRASLHRHDGRAYLTDYEYLSIAQVSRIWSTQRKLAEEGAFLGRDVTDKGGGIIRNFWWHPGWIPFAEDGGGNLLCIDLAPGSKGVSGQILRWERAEGPLPSREKSFREWLRRYRDDLLAGRRFEVDSDGLIRRKA